MPRPLEEVVKEFLEQRDLGVDWAFLYRYEIDLRESLAEREKWRVIAQQSELHPRVTISETHEGPIEDCPLCDKLVYPG